MSTQALTYVCKIKNLEQVGEKGQAVGKDWVTTEEAAKLSGYTVRYIQQLAREGTISRRWSR
jgi:hypothetical protein